MIAGGLAMVLFGLMVSGKLGPLGRLPGDIHIKNGDFELYFPLATGILISIAASLILSFLRK